MVHDLFKKYGFRGTEFEGTFPLSIIIFLSGNRFFSFPFQSVGQFDGY